MPQHEPGIIHTWTFDQAEKWVDVNGEEHYVNAIDRDYALNILVFLLRSASYYRLAWCRQHGEPSPESGPWSAHDDFQWMEARPLFSALKRRILTEPVSLTAFQVSS